MKRRLWSQAGLSLAIYVVALQWALKLTPASHVALYLGCSPVWALLWEGRPERSWNSLRRYAAAMLALAGVAVLFWPKLRGADGDWLAIAASVIWTAYSRQCRRLGATLSGAQITAESMWRASLWLAPYAVFEVATQGVPIRAELLLIQLYSIICSGIIGFALWNNALRHWPTSRVFLFSNLFPIATAIWARFCLGEPLTITFIPAMILIILGVILGQANWPKPKAG
jgi:drug/metabolite transporter (DMT)-like permease